MKRKISAGPELQPIFENENEVETFKDNIMSASKCNTTHQDSAPKKQDERELGQHNSPPKVPSKNVAFEKQINYVNDTLLWLRSELADLKHEDKNLIWL